MARRMRSARPRPAPSFRSGARQGEPFWGDGTVTTVRAAPDRTGGAFLVAEQLLVAGRPRAARIDAEGDEILYLLDGIVDALVGSEPYTLEPGGMVFVPRGVPVVLRVLSGTARILIVGAPAGPAVLRGLVTGR